MVRILIVQVVVPLLITVLPWKYGLEVRAKFSPSACTQISVLPVPKLPARPYFQVLDQCSKRVCGKEHFRIWSVLMIASKNYYFGKIYQQDLYIYIYTLYTLDIFRYIFSYNFILAYNNIFVTGAILDVPM